MNARQSSTSRNSFSTKWLRPTWRRAVIALMALSIVCIVVASMLAQGGGNITPNAIEVDNSANLYPGDGNANIKNPPASVDWVKDSLANTDVDPDPNDSIAIGITPNVTGAVGGVGHWNGVRIVDGIGGGDQNIFLTGGKENDVTTWNPGPGSVGSSKYDITQAYIASNQSSVFFGMERRGTNGTTAFDFEFNEKAPLDPSCGNTNPQIPCRTVGDKLVTFELQGAGNSGSATPFFFIWNGTAYVLTSTPGGTVSSINNTDTPPAPWGYVDSKGNWVLTPNLPRFSFAEAAVPLSAIGGGVSGCGGSAFVQVRTRSSSTDNSDLKDTTRIFQFIFGGPSAAGSLTPHCNLQISYDGAGSTDSSGGSNLTYSWQFQKNSLDDGTGTWTNSGSPVTGKTGTFNAPSAGRYRAILTVTEGGSNCTASTTTNEVNVYTAVGGSITITPDCDDTFGYSATGTGGTGTYTFDWTIQKLVAGNWVTAKTFSSGPAASSSGTLDIDDFNAGANGDGHYRASVVITDAQLCNFTVPPVEFDVLHALSLAITKTNANGTNLSVTAALTGADPSGTTFQWQRFNGSSFVDIASANTSSLIYSSFESDATPSATSFNISTDPYSGKLWSVQLRLHGERTVNGTVCSADSNAVTVKKVTAVDP